MQDEITETTQVAPAPTRRRKWYLRWWAWLLWILLAVLCLILGAALWAWTERYSLAENYVRNLLAEQGIEADLNIISVSQTEAHIKNLRLAYDDARFLDVGSLRAEYQWRDAVEGQFERVDFDEVKATITLNDDWKIVDGWLPPGLGGGTGGADFPTRGIGLTDGTLTLRAPLGEAVLYADAEVKDVDNFTSAITLAPSDLSYRGFEAKGAGVAEIERRDSVFIIDGQVQTDRLTNGAVTIRDAHLRLDGQADLSVMSYVGQFSVDGQNIDSAPFAANALDLKWNGSAAMQPSVSANGTWTIKAQKARTPNPDRARALADTLSLSSALGVVPVAEHFSPQLTQTISQILSGADVAGSGHLDYAETGFLISPAAPITITAPQSTVTLTPQGEADFYRFDAATQIISAQLDAAFTRPVGLRLRGISLTANSPNGWRLDGINNFQARVATNMDWRTTDSTGNAVRLGPLNTAVRYDGRDPDLRRLSLDTVLDYDGPLPGGVVEALDLAGRLNVRLYPNRQALDFIPRTDRRIRVARLETPTDWIAENVSFNLPKTQNIFVRRASQSNISAQLSKSDLLLTRPAIGGSPAQKIDLTTDVMTLAGSLYPDQSQAWSVTFKDADYASDTLPGPSTSARAATADLNAKFRPDQPLQITLDSPAVDVDTPLVAIRNMRINLDGTPETYSVTHSGGTVEIVGSEFAATAKSAGFSRFPMEGRVRFANEEFIGQAEANITKADNAGLTVDYTFANGAGVADIVVPTVTFAPGGLQPQALLPALQGKIARVEGTASARLHVEFADGALTDSDGEIALIDMDVGTGPGPVSGVNTTVSFQSLWPVETTGVQTLTMQSFDPGLPLEDGVMTYELIPDGIRVLSAKWPLGDGAFSLDPFVWRYAASENRVVLRLENVGLQAFLDRVGNGAVKGTGKLEGTFPIVVSGVNVLVDGGLLAVKDGGVIQYASPIGADSTGESNELAGMAIEALKYFEYNALYAKVNGPLDGAIEVGVDFTGQNPNVLSAQPFEFRVKVKGELFNILRSFNSNAQVKAEVLRANDINPQP